MPNSPEEMMVTMAKNIKEKTGFALQHWLKIVAKSGEEKHMAIIQFLKSEHGLTHGYANFIAFKYRELFELPKNDLDLVAGQYSGQKSVLKPIYDELCKRVRKFGKDVEISPRKTYVTIRRSKQFAIFKASTKDRLDVGLVLKNHAETDRLQSEKQFSGMMTHCVAVYSISDVDHELIYWLKQAYVQA